MSRQHKLESKSKGIRQFFDKGVSSVGALLHATAPRTSSEEVEGKVDADEVEVPRRERKDSQSQGGRSSQNLRRSESQASICKKKRRRDERDRIDDAETIDGAEALGSQEVFPEKRAKYDKMADWNSVVTSVSSCLERQSYANIILIRG